MKMEISAKTRRLMAAAAVCMMLAVIFGAFGSHALKIRLPANLLGAWQTAIQYQLIHGLGLLLLGILSIYMPTSQLLHWSIRSMTAGLILFCGSLYLLALSGISTFGIVTPFGGVMLILSWALLAVAVIKNRI